MPLSASGSFENPLLRTISHFLIKLFGLLLSSVLSSWYSLDVSSLSDMVLVKIFWHALSCCDSALCLTESFQFQFIHCFSVCGIIILFRKLSPVPVHSTLLHTFSSFWFSVCGFIFRSLIHLDLSLVKDDKHLSICILPHADIQFNQSHLLKIASSPHPHWVFLASLSKCQVARGVRIYVWVFISI